MSYITNLTFLTMKSLQNQIVMLVLIALSMGIIRNVINFFSIGLWVRLGTQTRMEAITTDISTGGVIAFIIQISTTRHMSDVLAAWVLLCITGLVLTIVKRKVKPIKIHEGEN